MNKSAIEKFAVWARTKLIGEITYKAGLVGVTENGIADPLPQSTGDLQLFDIGTKDYSEVSGIAIKQRVALVNEINNRAKTSDYKTAFNAVVEEVAYTWFNRLIAIRFMEVNDYLPSGIRVLSSENAAKLEPDFVTAPFDTDMEFTSFEQDEIIRLKDENKLNDLFRMLFIKQCNKLHDVLPELFEKTDDYSELLLTISFTDKDGVVYHLTHDISEDNFNIDKEGQIEIIGWLYQYYNTELKNDTFAKLKKNIKITKERIPSATQLFTPDWIVRYMVENSLGRLWIEGHPNDGLKAGWKYYLEEAEQEESVKAELEKIREEYKKLNPEDIKVIDPCMGSGHILVYAFDVLMQIYESYGYTQRDAAKSIVENNLFGLDIDKRAYQLSYFAVMMKARQYNRRILTSGIVPNLFAIDDSSALTSEVIDIIADGNEKIKTDLNSIAGDLTNAKEYGSIIDVAPVDFKAIYDRIEEIENGELNLYTINLPEKVLPIIRQAEITAQKYDVVVTNPPYMGGSGMSAKLSKFVKDNYPETKSDLSTVFMKKTISMCKSTGYMSMINIPVWMFLSSYEQLRMDILVNNEIVNMVHLGRGVFGSDFGTVSFVIAKWHMSNYRGSYRRLFEKQGAVDSVETKEKWFLEEKGKCNVQQNNFSKIPGSPIAYWASEKLISAFDKGISIDDISDFTGSQHKTADNEKFLRIWWETKSADILNEKWIFYIKGGEYRKWYGNIDLVVDWSDSARDFYTTNQTSNMIKEKYWFKEGITYTSLTSSVNGFRYLPKIGVFDIKGPSIVDVNELYYCLGFFNTKIAMRYLKLLNPTITLQVKDVKNAPLIIDENKLETVENIVESNIHISKTDWDSFETSWDFKKHPLI